MTINQLKNILMNVRCGQFILDAGVMGDGFYLQVMLFGPHLDVQALLRIADEREMRVA